MEKPTFKLVGAPCGHHGQYTFYKALKITGKQDRIIAIGDFFFVRLWQDSELVSIGELQLLWTDRVSDQTLVSLRLYFLPENTPDGRNQHGEDEVLAINDKVVVKCEDLLSWVSHDAQWRWGLRAVWRGACAPDTRQAQPPTQPLHRTALDFTDVDKEKSAIEIDEDSPGVVVFSYPRYCRYRALMARLEGIQAHWLRDSLVAALGGYAAPTKNTRILYCKDTFEYPELEGHEFVCNHLAPKLKGRPRGRRKRRVRSRSHSPSPSTHSSDSDRKERDKDIVQEATPRRLTLRNSGDKHSEEEPEEETKKSVVEEAESAATVETAEDVEFCDKLHRFYEDRGEPVNIVNTLKDLSLRSLYECVAACGGYERVCRRRAWRTLHAKHPARTRRHYERYLLHYENHERRNGSKLYPKLANGKTEVDRTLTTIDVPDSPVKDETVDRENNSTKEEFKDSKDEMDIVTKPAEVLNREFLESLSKDDKKDSKPVKITVKPVEKLIEPNMKLTDYLSNANAVKLFEDNKLLVTELVAKHNIDSKYVLSELNSRKLSEGSLMFLNDLAKKLNLGNLDHSFLPEANTSPPFGHALNSLSGFGDKYVNGTGLNDQKTRPYGKSLLRAVRVKPPAERRLSPPTSTTPTTTPTHTPTPTPTPTPLTNFGIHRPSRVNASMQSDDEIVEVPYKPKTPEIIDLDLEYPESPQSIKKKKLDILKERGLEVTAIPNTPNWSTLAPQVIPNPIGPLINPNPIIINPVQQQIMAQTQLYLYNIFPNCTNGVPPPTPKVIQGTSIYGTCGAQKTVYGNPKDPFMPPPHILAGTPVKPQRNIPAVATIPQDILDLTCKIPGPSPSQKPAVEIVRVPNTPSPSKTPQNLSGKNYTLVDGKAVVGSNLEITLVNPKSSPAKNRPPQKRSSNGKFMSAKTPTPPKDYPKAYLPPSPSGLQKKPPIIIPNYQINQIRDNVSPTSSTGSKDSQNGPIPNILQNVFKSQNYAQMLEMQKSSVNMAPYMDPYMALCSSLGQMDQRQLALYRDVMANHLRSYPGLLNMGAVASTPTTKN